MRFFTFCIIILVVVLIATCNNNKDEKIKLSDLVPAEGSYLSECVELWEQESSGAFEGLDNISYTNKSSQVIGCDNTQFYLEDRKSYFFGEDYRNAIGLEGSDSDIYEDGDNDSYEGGDEDVLIEEGDDTHFVSPHERELEDGSTIWVDGDGDTSVDLDIEEGGGWEQGNPSN